MENPEIYLFGFYVLFPNFSFLCVFVRLWLFCDFPYCLSCLSPPSLLEHCAFSTLFFANCTFLGIVYLKSTVFNGYMNDLVSYSSSM